MDVSFPAPSLFAPRPLRIRLWQVGGLLLIWMGTIVVANCVTSGSPVSRSMLGHDFLAFYSAGTFVNEGRAGDLYNLGALHAHQRAIATQAGLGSADVAPWWNPPLVAYLFAPLARLPFETALLVWTAFNIGCLLGAALILMRLLDAVRDPHTFVRTCEDSASASGLSTEANGKTVIDVPPGKPGTKCDAAREDSTDADGAVLAPIDDARWSRRGLVLLLLMAAFPTLHFLGHGQNTGLSLLLLSAVAWAFASRRAVVAGLLVALLAYKPQHAALLGFALVLLMGWRVLPGLALTGAAHLAATLLLMPGALENWLQQLPLNLHAVQFDKPYLWDRHVTLLAFWRLLLQGRSVGIHDGVTSVMATLSTLAVVALLVGCWFKFRSGALSRERLLALAMLATPLITPFYFDYDLLLLAVPAALVAREAIASGVITRADRRFAWIGLVLMVWSMLNVHVAGLTGVNGSVLLLLPLTMTLASSKFVKRTRAAMDDDHELMLGYEDLQTPPRRAA